jgi:hypothetical protein
MGVPRGTYGGLKIVEIPMFKGLSGIMGVEWKKKSHFSKIK